MGKEFFAGMFSKETNLPICTKLRKMSKVCKNTEVALMGVGRAVLWPAEFEMGFE